MALFRTCCYCLSLRTACLAFGALEMLLLLLSTTRIHPLILFNGFPLATLLAFSAFNEKRLWLSIWIGGNVVAIVMLGVALVFVILPLIANHESNKELKIVLFAVALSTIITVHVIYTFIVHSFICELREAEARKADANHEQTQGNLAIISI